MTITEGQLSAFGQALVKAGIIDKSDIEAYRDLMEQALRDSLNDGVQVAIAPIEQVGTTSMFVTKPSIDDTTGKQRYRTVYDPIEIFIMSKNARDNEQRDKERKAHELVTKALTEWTYYDQRQAANDRRDIHTGEVINKDYFLSNLYPCPFSSIGCMQRFRTPENAQRHRYKHGG